MKKKSFLVLLIAAFAVSATVTSCKNDDDDDNNNNNNNNNEPALAINTANVATGTLDGTQFNYTAFSEVGWSASIDSPPPGSSFIFSSTIYSSATSEFPSVSVSLGNLAYPENAFSVAATLHNYITTGPTAFTYGTPANGVTNNKKVAIRYVDANDVVWDSKDGSQTGSTFEITETVKTTVVGVPVVKFKAKFNCKVYNSNGDAKTLNVTKFIGLLEAWS